jgi:hypothetical protein
MIAGVSPDNVEKALESVEIKDWWDKVGTHQPLAVALGTKGPRATGNRARDVLKELSRLRNQLAYGGERGVVISETQLTEAIDFIAALSDALDTAVKERLKLKQ